MFVCKNKYLKSQISSSTGGQKQNDISFKLNKQMN